MTTSGLALLATGVAAVFLAVIAPTGRLAWHLATAGLTAMAMGGILLAVVAWTT